MFADTSIVPSSEPCLVCKCSKRNLVCVRRVCKDQVSECIQKTERVSERNEETSFSTLFSHSLAYIHSKDALTS